MQIKIPAYLIESVIGILFFLFSLFDPTLVFGKAIGTFAIIFFMILTVTIIFLVEGSVQLLHSKIRLNLAFKILFTILLTVLFKWFLLWEIFEVTNLASYLQQHKIEYHCLNHPDMDLCARMINLSKSAASAMDPETKDQIAKYLQLGHNQIRNAAFINK